MPASPERIPTPLFLSPYFEERLKELAPSAEDERLLREFRETGYVVVDLEEPGFEALASDIIENLAPLYPADDRRLMEAWYDQQSVKRLACNAQVMRLLRLFYDRHPIPFQTLNFDSGTEQPAHSDTLHFHCVPERFMCGAWIALEDIDAGNGPLVVRTASHKLPVYDMPSLGLRPHGSDYNDYEKAIGSIADAHNLKTHELHMRKGQVAIWAANLLHGGTAIREHGRTRHSQVTHYYFEDCFYYLPLFSEPFFGRTYYREVIDIAESRFVPHRQAGKDLALTPEQETVRYPRPLPAGIQDSRPVATPPKRIYHRARKWLGKLRGPRE